MPKTPNEIKKGLEHCINGTSCHGCPYCEECATASDCNPMQKDLQGYIQQLESDKQQLEGLCNHMNQLRDAAAGRALKMEERVHQLEAERDAAVADLKSYRCCHGCKHLGVGFNEPCLHCDFENNCFEWRGVQKEE